MSRRSVPRFAVVGLFAVFVAARQSAAQEGARSAQADSTHRAAVLEMLQVMKIGDGIMEMIELSMADTTAGGGMVEPLRSAFLAKARARLPELLQSLVPGFASRLTPDDVREITAFFRSPEKWKHFTAGPSTADPQMEQAVERWALKVVGEAMMEMGDAPIPGATTPPHEDSTEVARSCSGPPSAGAATAGPPSPRTSRRCRRSVPPGTRSSTPGKSGSRWPRAPR